MRQAGVAGADLRLADCFNRRPLVSPQRTFACGSIHRASACAFTPGGLFSGYRFQLAEPFQCHTGILVTCPGNQFVGMSAGVLTFAAGYAWDGASGPITQDATVIRASLVHDGLFQLMREHELSLGFRDDADKLLQTMCKEDGMPSWLAWIVYRAVRTFGGRFADPTSRKPVLEAP